MNVLLTGGAGYIGSHVARALTAAGHRCAIYDNLSHGHAEAVADLPLVQADIHDADALRAALRDHATDTVIHLAAWIEAGESIRHPAKYFHNNTLGGLALLQAMADEGVRRMVFSSTAAVYGTPRTIPIREDARLSPINPYGASKLAVELMLPGFAAAEDMAFCALRYFNVAGADPSGEIGEAHDPETHLIPLVLQVAAGRREKILIFGDDYDTPDGTCIRDYIHVCDLAGAHVLAADALETGSVKAYNLGNGEGFSVRNVIETCRAVTGCDIPAELSPRRDGDPPCLVASSDRAERELGWARRYGDLATIIQHAWAWHNRHP